MDVGSIRSLVGWAFVLTCPWRGGFVWSAPTTVAAGAELEPASRGDTAVRAARTAARPLDPDGLAIPWLSNTRATRHNPPGPDDIVEPTFAARTSWVGIQRRNRPRWLADPDAILVPTFAEATTSSSVTGLRGADDIIDPWKSPLVGGRNRR